MQGGREPGRDWLLIAYVDARGEKGNLTGGDNDGDGKEICTGKRRQICFIFVWEPFVERLTVQGLFDAKSVRGHCWLRV